MTSASHAIPNMGAHGTVPSTTIISEVLQPYSSLGHDNKHVLPVSAINIVQHWRNDVATHVLITNHGGD